MLNIDDTSVYLPILLTMKAIVLSCDKYLKFAAHTILSYEKRWSNHPFTFRVPYGEAEFLPDFKQYRNKVELLQTDSCKMAYSVESPSGPKKVSLIRPTVLKLIEDIPDDEWIYWCMDDRYPIRMQEDKGKDLYEFIKNIEDPQVVQVNFIRNTKQGYWKSDKFLKEDGQLYTPNKQILRETVFTEQSEIKSIWMHQFLRAKVLRRIFLGFPDRAFLGKEMDSFNHPKLPGEKCYFLEKNIGIYGESSSRGEITENCVASFKSLGLELPKDMKISKKYYVVGELPYKFLGLEFKLPKRLDQFLTSVNRWRSRTLG